MQCLSNEQLLNYINMEIPDRELKIIQDHIKSCVNCNNQYGQLLKQIHLVKESVSLLDPAPISIPEFIFPEQEKSKNSLRIKPLIIRLSIAATILILISFSILLINQKKQRNIEMQLLQMQQEILISDMNEAWHNRDLIFTQFNAETGETEVFLSSKIDN